ncbi:MAG: serine/threonine protein kinase [Gammaproteobacteria bacterium]|nr:serine/threonine protein kinase [Gammaproteobacteria bacterium]
MTTTKQDPPYQGLSPERVLDAVEQCGYCCDGRLLALNSYENRVYQVGIEDEAPLIAKFYRAQRWSDAAIIEEHDFSIELAEQEIPVVAPLATDGATLHHYQDFRFALYPRRGGRSPDLDVGQNLEWLGRFIGRIHALGSRVSFQHRPLLDIDSFGTQSYQYVLEHGVVPAELQLAYRTLAEDVLRQVERCYQRVGSVRNIRLHGDCYPSNILWTDDGPHFVDFDDSRMGPAMQDLWMLLSGDRAAMSLQLSRLLEGYQQFHDFDYSGLHLLEALRTLRMMHYSAWLARRWHDPAFPIAFPWFASGRYWEEQILALREQAAVLDELPLMVDY